MSCMHGKKESAFDIFMGKLYGRTVHYHPVVSGCFIKWMFTFNSTNQLHAF